MSAEICLYPGCAAPADLRLRSACMPQAFIAAAGSQRIGLRRVSRLVGRTSLRHYYPAERPVLVLGLVTTSDRPGWSFLDWLTDNGYTYDHYSWDSIEITSELLAGHSITFINTPWSKTSSFTDSEKTAIQTYVTGGGSLALLCDTDDCHDACAHINQIANLFGFGFALDQPGYISVAYSPTLPPFYDTPNPVDSFIGSADGYPTTIIDAAKAKVAGWLGEHEGLVVNTQKGGVLGMGYDAMMGADTRIENVMEWLKSPASCEGDRIDRSYHSDGYEHTEQCGETDEGSTYHPNGVFGYVWAADYWRGQYEKAWWIWDFITSKNTTYHCKWKGILTAHPSYAGDAYFTVYVSLNGTDWTQVHQEHLTPGVGEDDEVALRTDSETGNYRYVKAELHSSTGGMAIDPSRLYVDGVWRD